MTFEQNSSMLFTDMNIPELFLSEYMCMANGDYVKIYLYAMFLSKYNSAISPLDLSKRLCIPLKTVEAGLKYWEENDVLIKKQNSYLIADLKQIAVNKLYKPKVSISLDDAIKSNEKNKSRNQIINTINDCFFQGVMAPTWYTDIDELFTKYNFDEEVMYALFQYCFDRQALHKNYMTAVADSWATNKVKTMADLDDYYSIYEKNNQIKKAISKKLGISRKLSEYEDAYINKWLMDYNYTLDVIEIALKKTTSKTNPSFDYLDKIITDWHEKNLLNAEEVENFLKDQKQKQKTFKNDNNTQKNNRYTDDDSNNYGDFSQFYINV